MRRAEQSEKKIVEQMPGEYRRDGFGGGRMLFLASRASEAICQIAGMLPTAGPADKAGLMVATLSYLLANAAVAWTEGKERKTPIDDAEAARVVLTVHAIAERLAAMAVKEADEAFGRKEQGR